MKTTTVWMVAALLAIAGCATSHEDASGARSAISECYDLGDPPHIEGCLDDLVDETYPPDDVFAACFEEHALCLAVSPDGWGCDVLLDACFGVYTPEPEIVDDVLGICYEEAERCSRDLGLMPHECFEVLGFCVGVFEEPGPIGIGDDIAELCFDGHLECLMATEDPVMCDLLLDSCLVPACVDGGPVEHPGDPCLEAAQWCYETIDPEHPDQLLECDLLLDGCWDPGYPPEPPPDDGAPPPEPEEPPIY